MAYHFIRGFMIANQIVNLWGDGGGKEYGLILIAK
jgi:hypothetical protein